MNFNAKGKGPLELPRLTSIGPGSTTSNEIGKIVFRGGHINIFNQSEFADNQITGKEINVWVADTAAITMKYDTGRRASFSNSGMGGRSARKLREDFDKEVTIQNLYSNDLIARKINKNVTGGLTTSYSVANDLASGSGYTVGDAKMVLFFERNRIPTRLSEVEYTKDFITDNPAIAGLVDKGSNMIVFPRVNDDYELKEVQAQYDVEINSNNKVIQFYKDPLSKFFAYEKESEIVAHASHINLDHSLFGACLYIREDMMDRMIANTVDVDIKEISDSNSSDKEKLARVYKLAREMMNNYSDRLVVCLVDAYYWSRNKMNDSKFKLFYDGNNFTDKYSGAVPFTDPTQF